ncbi:MAG: preprotein translocase subunit SecG [Clostridia bacterium]|nr:preprotein translocase subunit SecG [Clostridia bacterium]
MELKVILEFVLGSFLILFAIALVVVIMLQEGNTQGLGTITGGADTFLSKNKARSLDAFLARWTKVFVIGFVLVVLGINGIEHFM